MVTPVGAWIGLVEILGLLTLSLVGLVFVWRTPSRDGWSVAIQTVGVVGLMLVALFFAFVAAFTLIGAVHAG